MELLELEKALRLIKMLVSLTVFINLGILAIIVYQKSNKGSL